MQARMVGSFGFRLMCVAAVNLTLVTVGSAQSAQSSEESWFGVKMPAERIQNRADLYEDTWVDLGFQPLSLHLPASDDPYQAITGEVLQQYTREIVDFSLRSRDAGDTLWGRIAGMPFTHRSQDYLADKLRQAGVTNVHIDSFPRANQWWPEQWEVRLLAVSAAGPGTKDYVLATAFPSQGAQSIAGGSLEAELVYVGQGFPEDLVGRELEGKIAVVNAFVGASSFSHSARGIPARLVDKGIVGVITLMNIQTNHLFLGSGTSAGQLPAFVLSGDDGYFLRDVIAKAGRDRPLRMRLELQVTEKQDLIARNVIGTVEGTSDEWVVLTAHTDAYFNGAQDNATGVATLIHLAEFLATAETPVRNILFVGTGGHHSRTADGSSGSVGATMLRAMYPDIIEKTQYLLNLEHTSNVFTRMRQGILVDTTTERARVLAVTNRSPLLIDLMGQAFDHYGVVVTTRTNHFASGDPIGHAQAGIPVINLIESGLWYHSSGDRMDIVTPSGMERVARAFVEFLQRADTIDATALARGALN